MQASLSAGSARAADGAPAPSISAGSASARRVHARLEASRNVALEAGGIDHVWGVAARLVRGRFGSSRKGLQHEVEIELAIERNRPGDGSIPRCRRLHLVDVAVAGNVLRERI